MIPNEPPITPELVASHGLKPDEYERILKLIGRVPTFTELGIKGVEAQGWFGFFAPAKTPKAIVDQLNRSLNQALNSPDVAERLTKLGLDPATTTPEEFARIVASDYAKWGPVVKASGFTAE